MRGVGVERRPREGWPGLGAGAEEAGGVAWWWVVLVAHRMAARTPASTSGISGIGSGNGSEA
jgi:hypothetical protein